MKFWNVYGVEHDLEKAHVITDFILKARNTKKIDMLTDGKEPRQFLHTSDCIACLRELAYRYDNVSREGISTSQVLNGPLLQRWLTL